MVIQVLPEPEILDSNTIILLACKRNIKERTYGEKREFKFHFYGQHPSLAELVEQCKEHMGIGPDIPVSLAKYVPHQFEWKYINPLEEIVEKQGKKKKVEIKTLVANFDLRKFPFLMNDGDIIGLREDSEPLDDDFQTEADTVAREEFRVLQEKERAEKEKDRTKNGKRAVEHGIVFNAGF